MVLLDDRKVREQFPAVDKILYFDSAHQTPLCSPVRARLDAFYDEAQYFAGPKSRWLERIEAVRIQLANLLGVKGDSIAFTKNTSEGLNIAARGLQWEPGDNVVLLESEHPNNAYAWLAQRPAGLEVRQIPEGHGKKWADAETFASYVDERTKAIAISHVMFHSGQMNDITSLSELARTRGISLVVDAMQSVGVMPVNAAELGVAALAAGSHKGLLVPQGLGFLYTDAHANELTSTYVAAAGVENTRADLLAGSEPVRMRPSARRFEIGNFNLPAIHALGGSLDFIESVGLVAIYDHLLSLGDRLIDHLDRLGVDLVGPREREHRSHIYVLDLHGPEWAEVFGDAGVRLSQVRSGVRVSFGIYNSGDDVDRLASILERGLSAVK